MSIRSAWQRAKMEYSQLLPEDKTSIKICATGIAMAAVLSIWSAFNRDYDVTTTAVVFAAAEVFLIHKIRAPDYNARQMLKLDRN